MIAAFNADVQNDNSSYMLVRSTKKLVVKVLHGLLHLLLPVNAVVEKMSIYDLQGRLLYSKDFNPVNRVQVFAWNGTLSDNTRLKTGVYIVRVKTSVGTMNSVFNWK